MSDALEQASLIMVPSGYENGTLGSLKPLDGSGDFTFSRGSDISATRVNEDGLIEKGYENLLLQSNQFDTNWVSIFTTETGGQTGYDGSSDAWLLTKTDANGRIYQSISSSGVQSISIYAKAGTLDWVRLQVIDAINNPSVFFDLQNGVIGVNAGANYVDSSIESIGTDGWYRLRITFDKAITLFNIYPAEGDNDTSGTSGSIYIQDAMLNQGLVAYPYVETTTAPVAGGILEDMPRLDYTDSSCPALLLEPQRTNLVPYSEYFSNPSNGSFELSDVISPEGLKNTTEFISENGNVECYEQYSFSATSGLYYTISCFVKKNDFDFFQLRFTGAGGVFVGSGAWFNISTGDKATIDSGITADIKDAGNGWYRIYATRQATSSGGGGIRVQLASGDGVNNTNGDGIKSTYIYGAQLEDATYPTSYIPTYGTSQTRLQDSPTASNVASLIGQTEGTLFMDCDNLNFNSDVMSFFPQSGSVYGSGILIFLTSNDLRFFLFANSTNSIFTTSFVNGGRNKIAMTYTSTAINAYVNGVKVGTGTSAAFPQPLNQIRLGSAQALNPNKNVNQALYFPTALSDDECIALTTIS